MTTRSKDNARLLEMLLAVVIVAALSVALTLTFAGPAPVKPEPVAYAYLPEETIVAFYQTPGDCKKGKRATTYLKGHADWVSEGCWSKSESIFKLDVWSKETGEVVEVDYALIASAIADFQGESIAREEFKKNYWKNK